MGRHTYLRSKQNVITRSILLPWPTPRKISFARRPNCNGVQLLVLSCVLLDRMHDMIGSVFPITSEDMPATQDTTAMVHVGTSLVPRASVFFWSRHSKRVALGTRMYEIRQGACAQAMRRISAHNSPNKQRESQRGLTRK